MQIRPAQLEDVPEIVRIERENQTAPWSQGHFQREIELDHSEMLVGLVQKSVAAYGVFWTVVDEGHLINMGVDQAHQRKGLGRQMLTQLLLNSQQKGIDVATLEVRKSNAPAISLYEKMGFQHTAVRKKYYPDNGEDALVMWLYHLRSWTPPAS